MNTKSIVIVLVLFILIIAVLVFLPPLTTREWAVLVGPGQSASPEEKANYAERVKNEAKRADVLTIGVKCEMNPLVLKLKEGEMLKLKNTDIVVHTVAFEDQSFFTVSPGRDRSIDLAAVFGKGEGIYRYRCNDVSFDDNVGVLYITR